MMSNLKGRLVELKVKVKGEGSQKEDLLFV